MFEKTQMWKTYHYSLIYYFWIPIRTTKGSLLLWFYCLVVKNGISSMNHSHIFYDIFWKFFEWSYLCLCEFHSYLSFFSSLSIIFAWKKEWWSYFLFYKFLYITIYFSMLCDKLGPLTSFGVILKYLHLFKVWVWEDYHLLKKWEGDV